MDSLNSLGWTNQLLHQISATCRRSVKIQIVYLYCFIPTCRERKAQSRHFMGITSHSPRHSCRLLMIQASMLPLVTISQCLLKTSIQIPPHFAPSSASTSTTQSITWVSRSRFTFARELRRQLIIQVRLLYSSGGPRPKLQMYKSSPSTRITQFSASLEWPIPSTRCRQRSTVAWLHRRFLCKRFLKSRVSKILAAKMEEAIIQILMVELIMEVAAKILMVITTIVAVQMTTAMETITMVGTVTLAVPTMVQ